MLSRIFLIKQGKCCGNGCLMSPYKERHNGKSKKVKKNTCELRGLGKKKN